VILNYSKTKLKKFTHNNIRRGNKDKIKNRLLIKIISKPVRVKKIARLKRVLTTGSSRILNILKNPVNRKFFTTLSS
jgi:hypothetical protein